MSSMACKWCGRIFDRNTSGRSDFYCSEKCAQAGKAGKVAKDATGEAAAKEQIATIGRILKFLGIAIIAVGTLFVLMFYKFPKFLKEKNKKLLYAYIITWAVLIIGTVVYFSFFSPEAFSGIKIKIVSAYCDTQEKAVSIIEKALSEASGTLIGGEEFTAYSQQALNAVKERNSLFKDVLYFVRLPDKVNVYIWFKTEDQILASVFRTK